MLKQLQILNINNTKQKLVLKSVQVMVHLHIFPIFSFLTHMLSSLSINDNVFAKNENIGKTWKRTIT